MTEYVTGVCVQLLWVVVWSKQRKTDDI